MPNTGATWVWKESRDAQRFSLDGLISSIGR
jgi:hypothetical protein